MHIFIFKSRVHSAYEIRHVSLVKVLSFCHKHKWMLYSTKTTSNYKPKLIHHKKLTNRLCATSASTKKQRSKIGNKP